MHVDSYSLCRPSVVEWLKDVPGNWDVRRLGALGRFFKGNGGTKADETEEGVPCIRYGDLYTRHRFHISASKACVPTHRAGAYTSIRYGDVLFAGSGESLEEIGKSAVNLIRGSAVCGGDVIVFRPTTDLNAEFMGWSTDYRHAACQKAHMGRGITVMHIYASELKCVVVPLPPLSEQRAIVRFLDYADRRIQRYIRAKERLIELLEEQERAVIHQAVTGQIDVRTGLPYRAYKDSGAEWLGEVPEHWELVGLGRIARDRCDGPFGSGLKSSHYTDAGVRVVRLQNIGHGVFADDDQAFVSPEHYSTLGDHAVVAGDVLVAGLGDDRRPAGRACVAPQGLEPAMVKADCFRFRLDGAKAHPGFVALQLTATARVASRLLSTGATRQRTNLQTTVRRRIAIPGVREQVGIADYLATKTRRFGHAIEAARNGIALLQEYRTRLIADVVTGKLDVREAAADLPETDPLPVGDRSDDIDPESNRHPEHDMAKEVYA